MKKIFFLMLILIFSSTSFAADIPKPQVFMGKMEYKKALKKLKKTSRRAVAQLSENKLESEFVVLRNSLVGGTSADGKNIPAIETAEGLESFINNVEKNYSNYKQPSGKFLASIISFMSLYKGIIHRAKPLVAKNDFSRMVLVNGLRFSAQATNVFMPTQQWQAGFDYTIIPFKDIQANSKRIANDADFKKFVIAEVIPALLKFKTRLNNIDFSKGIVWDNKIFNGKAEFADNDDRFVTLTENEKNSLLALISGSLSSAYAIVPYKISGLFSTMDRIAKLSGLTSIFRPTNATARKRAGLIKAGIDIKLDRSKVKYLDYSYNQLVESINYAKLSQQGVQSERGNSSSLFNATAINGFNRINNNIMNNVANMVIDEKGVSTVVTGSNKLVRINFRKFFGNDAPAEFEQFLPNGWEGKNDKKTKFGQDYHTYRSQAPKAWNVEAYKKYFPDIKNNNDIKETNRLLSQAYGGAFFGGPMSLFIF